jgi:hypothetical protein
MPIKSERLVPLTGATVSPAPAGYVCSQGVQLARHGADDPLVALPLSYKMPLPEANVVMPGGTGGNVVMAFPFSATAPQGPPPPPGEPINRSQPRFLKKIKRTSGGAGDRRG